MSWRRIPMAVAFAAATFSLSEVDASEVVQAPISVGEVTPPPASLGIDATLLRATAADEIRLLDATRLPKRRKVVVSLALTNAAGEHGAAKAFACTVNATLRDAETGSMIAINEAGARAEEPASVELRKQVANAAVRSAVRRIPRALGAK